MKHYPLLTALIMALAYLAFGAGCCWEEPVEVGAESAAIIATTSTGDPEPSQLLPPPDVMVVDCENGEAHAFYPGHSREDLATIHAMGHLLAQPGDYVHKQAPAYIATGEVWIDCVELGFDYVTFVHR